MQSVNVTAECEMHLAVTKTADASYDRAFTWTILKGVDATTFTIPADGTSATANYTVSVTKSDPVDSNFQVFGAVTITNDGPITATITDVDDSVAATDCAVPFDLPPGESIDCHYSLALDAPADGTNNVSVSVSQSAAGIGPFTASDDYAFGDPTTVTDDCVDVTDSYAGPLGNTCASQNFYYSRTFTRGIEIVDCNTTYSFPNTASFTAGSGAYGEAFQSVDVIAVCQQITGCSPGYWKNHPEVWASLNNTLYNTVISSPTVAGNPTLLEVLQDPGTYAPIGATDAVANYLSQQFGLTGYPPPPGVPEVCPLN